MFDHMLADQSLHAMGNGRLLLYGQGPQIAHAFGPPYTSSDQFGLAVESPLAWETGRLSGTLIWQHAGYDAGRKIVTLTDVLHPDLPVWARRITLHEDEEVHVRIRLPSYARPLVRGADGGNWRQRVCIPGGAPLFMYRSAEACYYLLVASGVECLREEPDQSTLLRIDRAEAEIRFVGGPSFPANRETEMSSERLPFEQLMELSRRASSRFFARIHPPIPAGVPEPLAKEIRELSEDAAVLICAQQSEDGGVIAGYPFPLVYVRDQYGVSRGLLALGLYEEAERMLRFRMNKWRQYGNMRNAESTGEAGIRHVHENDDVEQTAYAMLQAFDFADATERRDLLAEWLPMLVWCFEAQIAHLADGMLPFNGDETYVAGGFLKRESLNDGSAEATLLFIEAGRRLVAYLETKGPWEQAKLPFYRSVLDAAIRSYPERFIRKGRLIANNPQRGSAGECAGPRFRHGVCMTCPPESLTYFGWTEKVQDDLYVCPVCRDTVPPFRTPSEPTEVPSVFLLPPYIRSREVTVDALRNQIEACLEQWLNPEREPHIVGYDLGLMLHALAQLGDRRLADFLRYVLDRRDYASSWSERYRGPTHDGCRARPWESAINLTAVFGALSVLYPLDAKFTEEGSAG